jgi:hypothetical protein
MHAPQNPINGCAEKKRLLDLLRLANHELSSLVDEVIRLAGEKPERTGELGQILAAAKQAREKAQHDYTAHVVEHDCGTEDEASVTVGNE